MPVNMRGSPTPRGTAPPSTKEPGLLPSTPPKQKPRRRNTRDLDEDAGTGRGSPQLQPVAMPPNPAGEDDAAEADLASPRDFLMRRGAYRDGAAATTPRGAPTPAADRTPRPQSQPEPEPPLRLPAAASEVTAAEPPAAAAAEEPPAAGRDRSSSETGFRLRLERLSLDRGPSSGAAEAEAGGPAKYSTWDSDALATVRRCLSVSSPPLSSCAPRELGLTAPLSPAGP